MLRKYILALNDDIAWKFRRIAILARGAKRLIVKRILTDNKSLNLGVPANVLCGIKHAHWKAREYRETDQFWITVAPYPHLVALFVSFINMNLCSA